MILINITFKGAKKKILKVRLCTYRLRVYRYVFFLRGYMINQNLNAINLNNHNRFISFINGNQFFYLHVTIKQNAAIIL